MSNTNVKNRNAAGRPRKRKKQLPLWRRILNAFLIVTVGGVLVFVDFVRNGVRNFRPWLRGWLRREVKTMTGILGLVAGGLVVLAALICLIVPDREYSETENRMLEQRPSISWTSIREGNYTSRMETYVADQFVGRDLWIRLRTGTEELLGNYYSGGVYKGDDGYLLDDVSTPASDDFLDRRIMAMNSLSLEYPKVDMAAMIVPTAANIYRDKLPGYATTADQNRYLDELKSGLDASIPFVDVRDSFREAKTAKKQLYYYTDHHWTVDGINLAFKDLMEWMELDEGAYARNRYALTDSFRGTLCSRSGFSAGPDVIETMIPAADTQYVVEYVQEGKKAASLYQPDKLKTAQKYEVFFGGNYAQVNIRTTNTKRTKLLILKDSYANGFVPLMIPYYGKIIMIDPRYYSGDLSELIEQEDIDALLYLFNANTFMEDESLTTLLLTAIAEEEEESDSAKDSENAGNKSSDTTGTKKTTAGTTTGNSQAAGSKTDSTTAAGTGNQSSGTTGTKKTTADTTTGNSQAAGSKTDSTTAAGTGNQSSGTTGTKKTTADTTTGSQTAGSKTDSSTTAKTGNNASGTSDTEKKTTG